MAVQSARGHVLITESFHRKYSCCSAHTLQKSLFPSLTPLVALGSVKCEYDPGPHPLQQEGSRPEPRQRARVHSRWRKRPVPVPELRPGPGRLSGPLWLVRITVLKPTIIVSLWPPSLHPSMFLVSRWVCNSYSIRGGKPLWVDPFDHNVQHIFIDDNVRLNDEDTIIHPKVRHIYTPTTDISEK